MISNQVVTSNSKSSFPIAYKTQQPVCYTSGCKSESSRILSFINHSVDLCENFYDFSCGGMLADYATLDTDNNLKKLTKLIHDPSDLIYLEKIKTFYDSCLRYDDEFNYDERLNNSINWILIFYYVLFLIALFVVKSIMENVGSLYLETVPETLDLTEIFVKVLLGGSLPLFDVGIVTYSNIFILKVFILKIHNFTITNLLLSPITRLFRHI